MILPDYVERCVRALEDAGYPAFVVGGCVRDALLGIPPHDYDMCTRALPEQTMEVFRDMPQVHAGLKHGTVGVISGKNVVEITTFRQEGSYQDNRHPDWVKFVPDVESDLARRDFTVNAIAWSPLRGYADPFGGQQDLKDGILRAVSDPWLRFREDALRILRGMRFAVRFRLQVEPETEKAMFALAPLMDNLARERVYAELTGFLPLADADDLARFAPILCRVIPELEPMVGFDQHSPHHAYDVYTHTAYVTQSVPGDLILRWAALLHDIGKVVTFTRDAGGRGHFYGHAQAGAEMADAVLRRLKAPNEVREEVVWLIDHHMTRLVPDKKLLRRYLSRYGRERLHRLFLLQEADMGSKGTGEHDDNDIFPQVKAMIEALEAEEGCMTLKALAVDGNDLKTLGFSGREIGKCLNRLLETVLDESAPNDRAALLEIAEKMKNECAE